MILSRVCLVLLLLVFAASALRNFQGCLDSSFLFDFAIYHEAGRALNEGRSPYDVPGYIYPPAFAAVVRPLARLPLGKVGLLWTALNLLFLAATVRILCPMAQISGFRRISIAYLLVLLAPPTAYTLQLGQVNVLLLLLLASAAAVGVGARGEASRKAVAGILLGVATMLKVYPAIPSLALVTARRGKALVAMFATLVFLGGVGILFGGGPTAMRRYLSDVLPRLSGSVSSYPANQSSRASAARLFSRQEFSVPTFAGEKYVVTRPVLDGSGIPEAAAYLFVSGVVIMTAIGLSSRRASRPSRNDFPSDLSVLTCVALLVIPVAWEHYHVLLAFPCAVLWGRRKEHPVAIPRLLLLVGGLLALQRHWRLLTLAWVSPWLMMSGFLAAFVTWMGLLFCKAGDSR